MRVPLVNEDSEKDLVTNPPPPHDDIQIKSKQGKRKKVAAGVDECSNRFFPPCVDLLQAVAVFLFLPGPFRPSWPLAHPLIGYQLPTVRGGRCHPGSRRRATPRRDGKTRHHPITWFCAKTEHPACCALAVVASVLRSQSPPRSHDNLCMCVGLARSLTPKAGAGASGGSGRCVRSARSPLHEAKGCAHE